MSLKTPIYLDNHATTACDPIVLEAMLPWFTQHYGNASSHSHRFGYTARSAVALAREQVATLIGAQPSEIVFTSGATEANNLAILGLARAHTGSKRHLITSAIEHPAVLDATTRLTREGFQVTVVGVNHQGQVSAQQVAQALREDTLLVSIMLANNEVGTLQPIAAIGELCKQRGVFLHTDAVQAVPSVPVNVTELGVDLLSMSGHKGYGPKGIGALYIRRGNPTIHLQPLVFGGGQERGLRAGTLAVPLIVGMGKAAELLHTQVTTPGPSPVEALRDRLWEGIRTLGGVVRHGPATGRLPGNLNITFQGVEAEALLMALRDIAVSGKSACSSGSAGPSHVLRAMGCSPELAHNALRFGLGRFTTPEQIDYVIERITHEVPRLRALAAEHRTPAKQ